MPSKKNKNPILDNSNSTSPPEAERRYETFPIVGIGASAGGLEALQTFFHAMPAKSGMAFVVVTHQHPGHESLLPELLSRETAIPVKKIDNGEKILPDQIYVLSPGTNLTIRLGALYLEMADSARPLHLPIDIFFRSLASDLLERAICIVLSGTGADGTLGVKEVKAHGGVVFAQDPRSAKYTNMPASAIATGLVDLVVVPELMPERLINFIAGPYLQRFDAVHESDTFSKKDLADILKLLLSRTGQDFSSYKPSTVQRRIERRMSIHGLKSPHDYLGYLRENQPEAHMLFSEMLISVTSFFRDPDAFAILHDTVVPELINAHPDNSELRVWIPGCATGEEAYSIAMVFYECIHAANRLMSVKIFATDLDNQAIQQARRGVYSSGIAMDVSPERLAQFFIREGEDAWQVRKEIRDMLVFALQNMLSDPPFTKLDFIVCRNVLIYMQSDLQRQLLPTFHYTLNPGGILFLGASESLGPNTEFFDSIDARWKIYRRREGTPELPQLPLMQGKKAMSLFPESESKTGFKQSQTAHLIERFLLQRFAPVNIVIDRQGTIVYIHGRTGAYLEPEQQLPRNNILEMAREGLRLPLSTALHKLQEQEVCVSCKNLNVKTNGDYSLVNLCVSRIHDPEALRGLLLVTISPSSEIPANPSAAGQQPIAPLEGVLDLERELHYLKQTHQTTIEELQSSNEELQSTNEELQSSKEEMESLNEEMATVNSELTSKVADLGQARNDMKNLLNSTDIAVIYLDTKLNIKRFTEKSRALISLRETDIGRPIEELSVRMAYNGLVEDCRQVLDTLECKEKEIATQDGTWQFMRILPYRTTENLIAGVVITFIDTTRIKDAESRAESRDFFEAVVNTVREPLIVLNDRLQVQLVNDAFLATFQTSVDQVKDKPIYDLGNGQWNIPALRKLLEDILPKNAVFADFTVEHDFPIIGTKKFILNARRLQRSTSLPGQILLAMEVHK